MEHISSQVALIDRKEVAIIGVAGLFPGASDLESLFEQLKSGTDWVRKLSDNRLTDARCDPLKTYRPVGYLDAVDKFDHSFFGISKSEAEAIDPVQRLLLELVYTAFEDGGIGPENFQTEKISLFIGGLGSNYQALSEMSSAVSVIGNTNGIIAGRIAYALDLRGSAIMLDTTCSSALTAIREAYMHIVNGDMKMAVAGSVNVQLFFAETDEFSPLNTMSEDGKCKPFDAKANGIGSGEGGGIIIMKNLSDAIADGDQIYAVIRGGATNNDGGLSNGLTAPSPEAQKNVILEAWKDAAVDPDTIGYVEAHGTGTRLGDPIEFQALTEAFKFHSVPDKSCALGAVKSNFGHLDHAAGMAGIFKILSGFKFGKLFPTLHFEQPNPFLDYANSALYVNTEYKDWLSENGPKRAGISSFGLSGTNVHLVLEEYQNNTGAPAIHRRENTLWLKVSAKTPQVLNEYCKKIIASIETTDEADLPNLLQTLNSSRGDYEYRFSATAENLSSLIQKLKSSEAHFFRKKVVSGITVLLSSGTLPEAYTDLFGELNPEIKRIRAVVLETYDESWAKVIADQLSFLMFLDFLGLKMARIVAGGLGRISQRVYNDLSLIFKIRQFIDEGVHLAEIDKTKLEHALSVISATEKNSVFIAVNDSCPLIQMVRQINANLEIGTVSAIGLQELKLNQFFEFCFRQGLVLDLKKYGVKAGYKVQAAPTYPFQKIRCWFDTDTNQELSGSLQLKEKLFVAEFAEDHSHLPFRGPEHKVFIAFTEDKSFSEQVIRELRKLNQVIVVQPGSKFKKVSADLYEVNKDNVNDFSDLFDDVKENQRPLAGILIDWGYPAKNARIGLRDQGFYSNYHIAKAFRSVLQARNFGVYVAAKGLFDADFQYLNTEASNWGFWKGILSDHPWLDMRLIDFASANQPEVDALSFLQEIGTDFPIKVARYENKFRRISLLRPYESGFPVVPATEQIKKGNYLITGGLGRIGRALCESLAPKAESLIILGSSDYREDPEKVKVMDRLKQSTIVEYHQVDIADPDQMASLLSIVADKYKQLHTIYHLAGKTDDFVSLEEKTLQGFERTIAPKIAGTILLKRFAEMMNPEFFILFSSLNSMIPKKNSFDYAAANAFEDHLAFKIPMQGHTKYISINWPGWDVFQDELSNGSAIGVKDGILLIESIKLAGRANVIVSNPADLQVFRINPFFVLQSDVSSEEEVQEEKPQAEVFVAESKLEESVESVLMQIWKDVLKSDDIGPEDDFFDIGGHSLNGTQVLNRIYKHFAVDVDMDDFFEYGTLKSQCDLVKSRIESLNNAALPVNPSNTTILSIPAQEDYATSDIQRTFWMNSQLQQDSRIYNLVFPFFIKGILNKVALEKTMLFLLNRHESLCTGFRLKDGEIRQFIIPVSSRDFNIRYEEACAEMSWDAYAQREHDAFFDLNEGLLIKACTVSFREDYHLFVLTLHHLNADGWSHGVLLREFILAYKAYSVGAEPDLSPLKFQYKDYVVWLQNLLATQEEEDSAYWNDKLYGQWPMLEVPEVVDEEAGRWGAGTLKITIPLEETLHLKTFAKQQDVTLFMLLVTVCKVLLHQSFGWNDVVIGTVTSGRIHPDLENQIGNYLNTLALRDAVYADMPFSGLLTGVRQTVLEAFKHQSYPFTKIVEQRLKDGVEWQERWLDVQVNLHNYQRVEDYLKDETSLFEVPEETTNYDHDTDWNLHFNCLELEKDVLSIYINYSKQFFTEESIQFLRSDFLSLLKLIIINPTLNVGELTAKLRSTVTLKQTKKQLL